MSGPGGSVAGGSGGWTEVGASCFARRYASFDLTVGVVVGSEGLLVVDTRASLDEADELRTDLGVFGAPVRWVVNTHWHFDHCFGNARFVQVDDPTDGTAAARQTDGPAAIVYGHESVPAMLAARSEEVRAELAARSPEWARAMADLVVSPPRRTFATVASIDLGDRVVEVVHPGRGHTAGDVVVRVPDADVVYAGDLVEESGPPAYGDDAYPLEWGPTLDVVQSLLTERTAVVPGHGAVVDRSYVGAQRGDIGVVAETIRRLAAEGVPVEAALASADWPYPPDALAEAVRRGYADVTPSGARRTLPLV
jgi:glyoxylase-like metal-dependent hydrolase (beta-lactamase superfamily II)